MTYAEFAADLPPNRTMHFTSAEEMEEALQQAGVYQPIRQLGEGEFRSALAVQSTELADLFSDRYKTAISIYLEPPAGAVGFLFPRSESGHFRANGVDIGNDKLLVVANGSGVDIVGPALVGSEAIAIPQTRFTEMTQILCPTTAIPEGTAIFDGDTAQLHALRKAVADLVAAPESEVEGEDVPNVIALAIVWMGDFHSQGTPEHLTVSKAQSRVAKWAQEYIEEHYSDAVHIEDLCRVTGVGVRTLQRCFREDLDITVSNYLKAVRLDSARRELLAAHHSNTSVTRIAMQNGCPHLGRFSVEFRERFGQSPRQTLAMETGQE